MAGETYSTSTTRHSIAAAGGSGTVFTAEDWTICTIRVPSTASGATYIYTSGSSKNESYKPEAGDELTVLLSPGTVLQIETDSGTSIDYSIFMTEIPLGSIAYFLDIVSFIAMYSAFQAGAPIPESAIVPPFRPEPGSTSTRGPGRVYIDPRGKLTGRGGR